MQGGWDILSLIFLSTSLDHEIHFDFISHWHGRGKLFKEKLCLKDGNRKRNNKFNNNMFAGLYMYISGRT